MVQPAESFSSENLFNPKLKVMQNSSLKKKKNDSRGDNPNYSVIISLSTSL